MTKQIKHATGELSSSDFSDNDPDWQNDGTKNKLGLLIILSYLVQKNE